MRLCWTITLLLGFVLRMAAEQSITYVNGGPEWKRDLIKLEAPAYPEVAKRWHVQGTGMFRVSIDIKTGHVTNVSIIKSTGYGVLDASAIRALRAWRWKPGKYREVNVPINFILQWPYKPQPGASPLPRSPY